MYRGRIRDISMMHRVTGFVVTFVIGGVVFGSLAGLTYWFPNNPVWTPHLQVALVGALIVACGILCTVAGLVISSAQRQRTSDGRAGHLQRDRETRHRGE